MPSQISFVDNTGSEGLAHWQMLDAIRRFACGYGAHAAPAFVGTGTGTLTGIDTYPATVTETWTITCTAAAANGGTFSVTGSVSGAQANATVGVPYDNGLIKFTLNDGATDFIVGDAFTLGATAGALGAGARWTTLRYLNPSDGSNRELILQGVGLSGDQAIFIGFRTYHSVSADYYNLSVAGFTGYVAGNAFTAQPGYFESGVPGHNQRIDYWLNVNAQRIVFGLKVGTPVYEHGYAGYFYPYATPGQFPYPLAVGGMLAGVPATRYSDTNHSMPYKGARANMAMRFLDGTWKQISCRPWTGYPANSINIYSGSGAGMSYLRDTGGDYPLPAVELMDASNVYGYLDGVHSITGFNNVVENTVTVGGLSHVVLQDVSRTGFIDYCALEMP